MEKILKWFIIFIIMMVGMFAIIIQYKTDSIILDFITMPFMWLIIIPAMSWYDKNLFK